MNKSVPTLLGLVIILLVVVLVVLIVNYRLTQGLGRGERVVGTVGGQLLTGEDAPDEFIDETSALAGGEKIEPQLSPALRQGSRAGERRAGAQEGRRGGSPPGD